MAASTGLLAIGIGVLAMGFTTLVTIVGAIRMVPRNWVKPDCSNPRPLAREIWVLDDESVMEREESHCPTSSLPASASSPFVPPSTPSLALFVFFLESSSLLSPPPTSFPLAELNSEGEEEREERATGWNPCCNKRKFRK